MVQLPLHNALVIYQCYSIWFFAVILRLSDNHNLKCLNNNTDLPDRGGGKMGRGWGVKLILLCCSSQIRGENLKKGKSGGGLGMLEGQEG